MYDLIFTRDVRAPAEYLWRGWTDPVVLKQWFCPRPWRVVDCKLELRPGGNFHVIMQGPDGEANDMHGCYLEMQPLNRLVWTNALGANYRPQANSGDVGFFFTCVLTLQSMGDLTRYQAMCLHSSQEDCDEHRAMGFEEGWGKALDQLLALR